MKAGRLIVLEGTDGAGTTTHTALLAEAMRKRGLVVKATAEPSGGPIGGFIRNALSSSVPATVGSAPKPFAWNVMALLFAADRLHHVDTEISPTLSSGGVVVSDRYYLSSLAYQSLTSPPEAGAASVLSWLSELNRYAPRPDLTLVLSVRPEVAEQRRRERSTTEELFDSAALQRKLAAFYDASAVSFPSEAIVLIDANRNIAEVHESILRAVLEH